MTTVLALKRSSSFSPTGWGEDTDMVQNPDVPTVWTIEMELVEGAAKFRADDDWATSWGGTEFPMGVGELDGPDIPVPTASNYKITFNTATGEYNFETLIPMYDTIEILGTATPGGWAEGTAMIQNPNDPSQWSLNIELTDGLAKFRADGNWDISWGAEGFPTDTAVLSGPDIPVTAGEYNVQFNSTTGIYEFADPLAIFSTIGVIGDATGLGWTEDIDMVQDPAAPDQWSLEIRLSPGPLKFRAENDWAVNWGDDGFPTGTGTQDGPDIMIPFEDNYDISFNATTGEYSLSPGVSWGIIGTGSPTAGWDDDTDMALSNTVGGEWSETFTITDGEVKFRKNDDWAVNFGAADFPAGTGTQDGPNIMSVAGNYFVTLNTQTGDYLFEEVNSTTRVLTTQSVKVFPNPAADLLNISVEAQELEGEVTLTLMDVNGKVISSNQQLIQGTFALDVKDLNNGLYILQISNDRYTLGKKFSIIK